MPADRFYLAPPPVLREFVDELRARLAPGVRGDALLATLRPAVERLLRDPAWISAEFRRAVPDTTATWAIYRASDPDLCIFSMVVPPGQATRVHNHLTDGWVGLVQGAQLERQYRRLDADVDDPTRARLALLHEQPIALGELTPLVHPGRDIHQIRTVSAEPSVSLHVLCNDLGTVERLSFDLDTGRAERFVSGYTNVDGTSRIGAPSSAS